MAVALRYHFNMILIGVNFWPCEPIPTLDQRKAGYYCEFASISLSDSFCGPNSDLDGNHFQPRNG